jgi:glycolate dehydrogenase FAD-binding subunit
MSQIILEPLDAVMAAALLARSGRDGLLVVPRGSGTKLAWSGVSDSGAYLSTRHLVTPIQHYAGDLVATIPAGATLGHANAVLASSRQWLPLDPPHAERATVGGIVAANDSGPRRHKYGSPRDLIVGIEIALTDGRVAKAGGRVVKNVAGYDLSRLLCGSFGSLAVITSATFKLAPAPVASRTVVGVFSDVQRAAEAALTVAAAPVTPSALEIEAPSARLLVRFETTGGAADRMGAAAGAILDAAGASTGIVADADERELWQRHEELIWDRPGIVLKMSVLPTDVAGAFAVIANVDPQTDWSGTGRAALGVLLIRLNGEVAGVRAVVKRLRQYAADRGGSVSPLEAPAEIRELWEPAREGGGARGVMRAVKERFDPRGTLPALWDSAL